MNRETGGTTTTQTVTKVFLRPPESEEEKKVEQPVKKPKPKRNISWREDTIDNESLNKLKSNVCCIYTPPRQLDGPSSSSTCSSDSTNELEKSRETKKAHKKRCSKQKPSNKPHNHQEGPAQN
eukprot:TRINITY_DN9280_c0_g1_i5.p2 TRINITY_DN9280_c0_g1~~TRINITY_DN9280_c0_g1_i5.p2  ORF type:complete len:123 (-),score=22.94 TRINITY_DN9280_c0_g1_i5:81-449(-)